MKKEREKKKDKYRKVGRVNVGGVSGGESGGGWKSFLTLQMNICF